ncbi:hypothetical protein BAUCODRAFT_161652 [Baudoinia panamericana UAMH 10762]|uniref:Uncharacterized protein n=1 Tax=Baudoinia panamericana (strain UAMH 10762) TaxID=717646 RepID=M2N8A7_BAUPA|nr:uncharacterized protein BAUCODRAFT_161652 [Baudoinia panamericana UAMH 10762]EMD00374.1 hypothetical protein BAUCODRAFT_161652 [Baudoinia panamericana UAMH 10762]
MPTNINALKPYDHLTAYLRTAQRRFVGLGRGKQGHESLRATTSCLPAICAALRGVVLDAGVSVYTGLRGLCTSFEL